MSSEPTYVKTEDGQLLTAEYKDGQLQIVEVNSFGNDANSHILPDTIREDGGSKYIQVLDSGKGYVQLDLLNFALVKCGEGEGSYQMVESTASHDGDVTLTCALASDDGEETEDQDGSSYVLLQSLDAEPTAQKEEVPSQPSPPKKKEPTPDEIIERAKALQRAKAEIQMEAANRTSTRGRKRKSPFTPTLELLVSPNFKLYLYNCKMCNFKCNAVKEMTAHKASAHADASRGVGSRHGGLQCARCPYRATSHIQLRAHARAAHHIPKEQNFNNLDVSSTTVDATVQLISSDMASSSEETMQKSGEESDLLSVTLHDVSEPVGVCAVDEILVCGECGFESRGGRGFAEHMRSVHGYNMPDGDLLLNDNDQ